jgi:aldehyde:ferredoxin oxidoreductase
MHVKGQPIPYHEPRGKVGVGLGYSVSPTGADHMEIPHDPFWTSEAGVALLRPLGIFEPVDALDLGPKKVRLFVYLQQYWNLLNTLGICMFTAKPFGPHTLNSIVDYVKAVTGWETSLFDLLKTSERYSAMARIFNQREGFTAKDDILPDRFFQPMEGGTLKGKNIDRKEYLKSVETYYEMMGWDPETGIPGKAKLAELDLDWLAQ